MSVDGLLADQAFSSRFQTVAKAAIDTGFRPKKCKPRGHSYFTIADGRHQMILRSSGIKAGLSFGLTTGMECLSCPYLSTVFFISTK